MSELFKADDKIYKSFKSENKIIDYAAEHSLRLTEEQKGLLDATLAHPLCRMLGDPVVLQLTSNLIKLIGGKKILDVGVYTGASVLSAGLAIPEDGQVYALDITDEYISIGRPYWKKAGIENKVNLILAPALDSLKKLKQEGHRGTFDFAFIDADKPNYINYYEECLTLIRPGGIIAIDNTIWGGRVIDSRDQSEGTKKIRELNNLLKDDQRINYSFLVIGDGLALCFKK